VTGYWRRDSQAWWEAALELEQECRELRRILTALLAWLGEREELLELARELTEQRFPRDGATVIPLTGRRHAL
jgi:hypothetical protein